MTLKSGVARKKQCHTYIPVSVLVCIMSMQCVIKISSHLFCSLMSFSVLMFTFSKKLIVVSLLKSYFVFTSKQRRKDCCECLTVLEQRNYR